MTTTPADIEADILRRHVACLDEQYDNLIDDHDRLAKAGEAERDAHRQTLALLATALRERDEAKAEVSKWYRGGCDGIDAVCEKLATAEAATADLTAEVAA